MNRRVFSALAIAAVIGVSVNAAPALAQGTQPIQFGKNTTYEHTSNWFTIDMPSNWEANDTSKQDEVIVTFSDPTGNAGIVVDVFPYDEEITQDEMGELLGNFISGQFKTFKKFDMADPKAFGKTGASIGFSYDQPLGRQAVKMYGDSFIELHDGKMMSIMTLLLPAEQFDKVSKKAFALLDTFQANPDALSASDAEAIGELDTYTHKTKLFSIEVPTAWDVTDNSKPGTVSVIFSNPDGYSFVMVEGFKNAKGAYDRAGLEGVLDSYVDDAIGSNVSNYDADAAEASGDDTASKTFRFTINDNDTEIAMTGIVYIDQVDNVLTFLRAAVPTDSIDTNKDALNDIGNSFKVKSKVKF
jgi:hypothetical protein